MDPCVVIMNEMLESGRGARRVARDSASNLSIIIVSEALERGWRTRGVARGGTANPHAAITSETTDNGGRTGGVRGDGTANLPVAITGKALEKGGRATGVRGDTATRPRIVILSKSQNNLTGQVRSTGNTTPQDWIYGKPIVSQSDSFNDLHFSSTPKPIPQTFFSRTGASESFGRQGC